MSQLSRRAFLKQSGATAAAAGAAVAVPKGLISKTRPERPQERPPRMTKTAAANRQAAERRLVVHVPDTSKSELHLLIGERDVVLRDHDLVARLVRETH
jgi:hypothetical protein